MMIYHVNMINTLFNSPRNGKCFKLCTENPKTYFIFNNLVFKAQERRNLHLG